MRILSSPYIHLRFAGILLFLYIVVQYFSPGWTWYLYEHNHLGLLDFLAGSQGDSPGYYLGMIHARVWGPLEIFLSGAAFLVLANKYLVHASGLVWGASVFLYLIVSRPEVLLFPVYGDAVGGPFAEAYWLARNNFDYIGLSQQPGYASGGPKVYYATIYPGFLAVLIQLLKHPQTFLVVNHLIVFAWASVAAAYARRILRHLFSSEIALLGTFMLLALPLFQSQVEAINMEMPTLMFGVMSLAYLMERRIGWAAILAILSAFTKGYGATYCVAVTFGAIVLAVTEGVSLKDKARTVFIGLLPTVFFLIKIELAFNVLFEPGQHVKLGALMGWPSIVRAPATYVFVLCLFVLIWSMYKSVRERNERGLNLLRAVVAEYYQIMVIFVAAMAWFGLLVNSNAVSPRYWLTLVPLLCFCFVYVLHRTVVSKVVVRGILVLSILVSFLASYGLLYPEVHGNNHVVLERSLEYRNDLHMYQALLKTVDEQYVEKFVGAPHIVSQMLSIPQLGYVTSLRPVVIYGFPCRYLGNVYPFYGLDAEMVKSTIWIALDGEQRHEPISYPVGLQDRVLTKIVYGQRSATLFVGGFAIEAVRLAMEEKIVAGQIPMFK